MAGFFGHIQGGPIFIDRRRRLNKARCRIKRHFKPNKRLWPDDLRIAEGIWSSHSGFAQVSLQSAQKEGRPIGRPSEALLGERISLSEAEISSNEKSFQVPFRGVEARTRGSANQKNFQQRRASCSTTFPKLVQMQENLCIN
jgi:hypothetical protein